MRRDKRKKEADLAKQQELARIQVGPPPPRACACPPARPLRAPRSHARPPARPRALSGPPPWRRAAAAATAAAMPPRPAMAPRPAPRTSCLPSLPFAPRG